MPHVNQIFRFVVDSVSDNAAVNFGGAIITSSTANSKDVGGQTLIGDNAASPHTTDFTWNFANDPNIIDQPTQA